MSDKIFPGQTFPFSAKTHNSFVDARDKVRRLQSQINHLGGQPITAKVFVKNQTGADAKAGSPITIGDMSVNAPADPDVDRVVMWFDGSLEGIGPNNMWGIYEFAAPDGSIKPAVISGVVQAWVYIADERHNRAAPVVGESNLVSVNGTRGAKIFWKPSGTGLQLCAVQLPPEDDGVQFLNSSGETVPPNAVMRVTAFGGTLPYGDIVTIGKPDDSHDPLYLVNREIAIEDGAYGVGDYLIDCPGRVRANLSSGTPAKNFRWGTLSGSWLLHARYQGFSVRTATTGSTTDDADFVMATQDPILNDTVAFYNDSGEEIPAFAVMELKDDFDPAGRQFVTKPTTEFQRRYLVNNDRTVPYGSPGHGSYLVNPNNTISSRVLCATSPDLGDEYGATPGEWFLSSYRPGFHMLGNAQVTGDYFTARAIQREVTRHEGYLVDGALTHNGSASFQIWKGPVGTGGSSAGWANVTCWSTYCDDFTNAGQDLWGVIDWQNGEWRYKYICCPSNVVAP